MGTKLAVIAIGGNSLIKSKDRQTVEDQQQAVCETIYHVADLIEQGYQVVISHGNGPQVGFIMLRSEVAWRETGLHLVPLESIVAGTQSSIGYLIQQALGNELVARGKPNQCITVVTQVVVDRDDPGFLKPTKPVGQFYDIDQVEEIYRDYPQWTMVEDAGRGFRRVVPSPEPIEIVEKPVIESLLTSDYHVVALGGGGIPVVRTDQGLRGVDAVIDKDLASSLLASQLCADLFIISTAVENVFLNFGQADEKKIVRMTVAEARQYITDGHFAIGSMLPKIQSALQFLESGGEKVIITSPEYIGDAVTKAKGTHIIP